MDSKNTGQDSSKPIKGILISTISSEIRKSSTEEDLALVFFEAPTIMAACFTKNSFAAAPVIMSKENIKNFEIPFSGALVINSGCANAGTGVTGKLDCEKITKLLGKKLTIPNHMILPFSTGPIMERLPMKIIEKNINKLISNLGNSNLLNLAKTIMTTDTKPKIFKKKLILNNKLVTITGIAKGSGMISPNMATMLAFIFTDVKLNYKDLKQLVDEATRTFFNRISVDGDTSTNDSVIACANATSEVQVNSTDDCYKRDWKNFKDSFLKICFNLAKSIVLDGEGATKFITIKVMNVISEEEIQLVGGAIANSPLVKTAFYASDPNLGRILAAIGNAEIQNFKIDDLELKINDYCVFKHGEISVDYDESVAKKEMNNKEIVVEVNLKRGKITGNFYSCDFSHEYITINSDYRS